MRYEVEIQETSRGIVATVTGPKGGEVFLSHASGTAAGAIDQASNAIIRHYQALGVDIAARAEKIAGIADRAQASLRELSYELLDLPEGSDELRDLLETTADEIEGYDAEACERIIREGME